jgi:CHAT domain-containing protein
VVLSACNTGGGGTGKLGGESLSGLARAFFQAGTRSVLVSHWQVDSVATTRLMTRTFGHIGKANQRHTAQALQRAQLDLLRSNETAHPYFWAAFTLVGEGRDMNQGAPALSHNQPAPSRKQIGMSSRQDDE